MIVYIDNKGLVMTKRFALDMDGPCSKFIHGALRALDRTELLDNYPPGATNLSEITGIPYPEMYAKIDAVGSDFWKNLEETSTFWELYNGLSELGEVCFLTSPSLDSNSLKGKAEWLQDRFGKRFRNYAISYPKWHWASPDVILIDDTKEQCDKFIANGGLAVQYPTRLNGLHDVCAEEHRAKYVLEKVKELL
ncbi:hypothetical protein N9948_00795 [bacterium]|nr:hypothetical protein [bacterium]